MIFKKKNALEDSRNEKFEAIANLREGQKASRGAIRNLDHAMERLAISTTHAMVETVDFMRGKP